ncbi:MAG: hypothetical protein ACR2M1_05270 [Gemmatimonadaceae bacterium]
MTMKFAAEWIALNDEPMVMNADEIASFLTTKLAADMLGVEAWQLARRVLGIRLEESGYDLRETTY